MVLFQMIIHMLCSCAEVLHHVTMNSYQISTLSTRFVCWISSPLLNHCHSHFWSSIAREIKFHFTFKVLRRLSDQSLIFPETTFKFSRDDAHLNVRITFHTRSAKSRRLEESIFIKFSPICLFFIFISSFKLSTKVCFYLVTVEIHYIR